MTAMNDDAEEEQEAAEDVDSEVNKTKTIKKMKKSSKLKAVDVLIVRNMASKCGV